VLAIAYGAAYGASVGWLIFIPTAAAVTLGIVLLSPVIVVTEDNLRVGAAVIPRSALGLCIALDAAELTRETRRGDAAIYLALRTWASRRAVLVQVIDDQDPHSAWLISTRHPHTLQRAINTPETNPDKSTA
jgi:hypothetical protein